MEAKLDLARARSFLFVPASRPERIAKAFASGTDVVIVDLEDAVAPADKPGARQALLAWLDANPDAAVVVRINAAGTAWHGDDLQACRHAGVAGVMLPKADSATQVRHAHSGSAKPVLAIIETGAGLEALREIAGAEGCARLVFGKLDLAVELDLVPDEADAEELVFLPWRALLVLASQRAGLPAPVDGVFTVIGDAQALQRYAARARRHGFGGQLLIHPSQVQVAAAAFTPSASEIQWAHAVQQAAAAAGGGAAVVEGRMVDAPVISRAERVLAVAATFGL
ncbi:HpcH/HpaI aldolase/citrate lyase family protein [Thauera linaloolentis]|uniref:Citrate lyase subunit beta n=1 Tax=Thauera linaloolentis (strain DSM 12138 / JCM 21573 / CCUG 41526 / CIP 105981 / IAM 15112 / NBRC 102519 / 47Lol) TaxID=1123367 RepID=N6XRB2_THAL4|nr:CoA ester lyase [Thauera linaloolentis]ENO84261.1 citrate lyase subunit beta [Thauera linaloolentis 47Lol = DSM 12138]MCM8567697.1 CoA ester lyase [Thauera linaloolentis]